MYNCNTDFYRKTYFSYNVNMYENKLLLRNIKPTLSKVLVKKCFMLLTNLFLNINISFSMTLVEKCSKIIKEHIFFA